MEASALKNISFLSKWAPVFVEGEGRLCHDTMASPSLVRIKSSGQPEKCKKNKQRRTDIRDMTVSTCASEP